MKNYEHNLKRYERYPIYTAAVTCCDDHISQIYIEMILKSKCSCDLRICAHNWLAVSQVSSSILLFPSHSLTIFLVVL